jgi:drug/metabolite transporter (DMT)-like permease
MLLACIIWGLMSPICKEAMNCGISGTAMVTFRVVGGALCFWLASLFTRQEEVSPRDMLLLFFAGLLSVVLNQCSFTIGLSLTSPVDASIITTTTPIITLVLAALILHEPVTGRKVTGVAAGAAGAMILILGSASALSGGGSLAGDGLCLLAQVSFALYLTIFRRLIQRYSIITCEKWMFTYAAIVITPFSYRPVCAISWRTIPISVWAGIAFVVVCATFIAYILMMNGQKKLRPTVVSMYNYVQPVVATTVSVAIGVGTIGWSQAIAVICIFAGVWLVTQSQTRAEWLSSHGHETEP